MYNAGTTGWLQGRNTTQLSMSQTLPLASTRESSRELFLPALRWIGAVPSWTVLLMIILSTSAVCATVILRARGEFQSSSAQLHKMTSEIDSLQHANGVLQAEVDRLTTDSNAIELAARERLGMVRPNDIVVPMESIAPARATVSFVR